MPRRAVPAPLPVETIAIGIWRVDPKTGLVYGVRGHPIGSFNRNGYLQAAKSPGLGRPMLHRLVWEAVHGHIPEDKQINHINGIKTDNRIANLELVTPLENVLHSYRTGLASNQGVRHPQARLDDDAVRLIRRGRRDGISINELASRAGVHRRTVTDVLLGRSWTHVKEVA